MKRFLTVILLAIAFGLSAQKIEYTFEYPNDSTKNYYITVFPKGQIKGSLILLPGFGELPTETFAETQIHRYASENGYITIIPALGDWSFFYIDSTSNQKLNSFIQAVFKKYKLSNDNFFIGGFSMGGCGAVQYAQQALKVSSNLKKPAGVFAVDPPLDWERLYSNMLDSNKKPIANEENLYWTKRINKLFKTNPDINPKFFWSISPFARSDTSHNALKSIINLPIRIYNEPDINWYIDNRSADYYALNVLDSAAMIKWLKKLGNDKAELVITTGKGYRITENKRHPHSWSIVDAKELVDWMNKNKNGL
jgi:pimeloyl-ACP methyl ester carboxylesterase